MALMQRRSQNSYFRRLTLLKKLFWLYFLLLIFEGALRKWVAPQLSAPLLIIRDPIGIWIIWEAYRTRKWPVRWSTAIAFLTVLLMGLFAAQLIAGDNLFAELYGLRTYLLPFPVLFIMGENLDEEDLRRMGVLTLWILLPMSLLEVAQFKAAPTSFLNKGAYQGAAQISFAGAHLRASGTFSFSIGSEEFAVLAAAFIFYGMIREGYAKKWLLWASAFALLVSVPMMGSRTMVYQLAIMLGCMGLGAMMGISQFTKTLRVILPLAAVTFLVLQLPAFSNAAHDLNQRIMYTEQTGTVASQSEGRTALNNGIYRIITPMMDTIEDPNFWRDSLGIGMGQGAVAVNALLHGTLAASAGEGEFSREFREMGPIAGILFALFKLLLGIVIFGQALAKAREGEPLALLLVPLSVVFLFIAQLEQPTEQGFVVIGAAICIAAAKAPARAAIRTPLVVQRSRPPQYRRRAQRG
jgi:hypothetical protein